MIRRSLSWVAIAALTVVPSSVAAQTSTDAALEERDHGQHRRRSEPVPQARFAAITQPPCSRR
jgi:hypothetical protein